MRKDFKLPVVGDKYGLLTIIGWWIEEMNFATGKKRNVAMCECQCECGGTKTTTRFENLKNGHKKSCGCLAHKKNSENKNWKGFGKISSSYWSTIRVAARNRNISFLITIEEAWSIYQEQKGKCAISGVDIEFKQHRNGSSGTASLDRVNSKLDYTVDNVQWVHKDVNRMKWDLKDEIFIDFCKSVADYFKNKTQQ